jgi:hypothetical protein
MLANFPITGGPALLHESANVIYSLESILMFDLIKTAEEEKATMGAENWHTLLFGPPFMTLLEQNHAVRKKNS